MSEKKEPFSVLLLLLYIFRVFLEHISLRFLRRMYRALRILRFLDIFVIMYLDVRISLHAKPVFHERLLSTDGFINSYLLSYMLGRNTEFLKNKFVEDRQKKSIRFIHIYNSKHSHYFLNKN